MKTLFTIGITFFTHLIFAYVPQLSTINNKVVRHNGKSPIKIVQDIVVSNKETGLSYTLRETLYIKSADEIKITVEGNDLLKGQVNTSFIYKNSKRYSYDGSNILKSDAPKLFYAPLIYSNSPGQLKKYLVMNDMLPVDTSQPTPSLMNKYQKPSYTHLSRTNGEVSYAIAKKLSTADAIYPTLWVGTNNFQINKIRLNENSVISLHDYKKFDRKLSIASKQIVKWQNYKYTINVISAKAISLKNVNNQLSSASLKRSGTLKNYKSKQLETFYSAFR